MTDKILHAASIAMFVFMAFFCAYFNDYAAAMLHILGAAFVFRCVKFVWSKK